MPENTNTNQIILDIENEQQPSIYQELNQENLNSILENINQINNSTVNAAGQGAVSAAPFGSAAMPIDIVNTIKKKHQQKNIDNDSKTPNYVFSFIPLDLQLQTAKHKKIIRDYYYNSGNVLNIFEFKNPLPIIGIEIETENILYEYFVTHFWNVKEDHSLRNNGVEFTSKPLEQIEIEPALHYLKRQLEVKNKPDMSPRTSVHIHVNCRDFTWDQIKTIILLYSIFEHHFYNIAGKNRENSIFCVPLYKTEFIKNLLNSNLEHLIWSKYCGINILPLMNFGTIEFRHLYGTLDPLTILEWIDNIGCLISYATKTNFKNLVNKIENMNSDSSYAKLYTTIFGEKYINATSKQLEFCISQIKRILFGDIYYNNIKSQINLKHYVSCSTPNMEF